MDQLNCSSIPTDPALGNSEHTQTTSKRLTHEIHEFWKFVGSPEFSYRTAPKEASNAENETQEIERVDLENTETIFAAVENSKPLIIDGAGQSWPCFNRWTWEFFRDQMGDTQVSVDVGGASGERQCTTLRSYICSFLPPIPAPHVADQSAAGAPPVPCLHGKIKETEGGVATAANSGGKGNAEEQILDDAPALVSAAAAVPTPRDLPPSSVAAAAAAAVAEVAAEVDAAAVAADPPYLRLWTYARDRPELARDFTPPAAFEDWFGRLPSRLRPDPPPHWIFVGPAGTYTPLHLDPWATHAWFAQLQGRKRFILFPPEDTRKICDGNQFVDVRHLIGTVTSSGDAAQHFADCRPRVVTLKRGQLLFLPRGWAHAVLALDPSISLTHNFLSEGEFKNVRMAFLMFKMGRVLSSSPDGPATTEGGEGEEHRGDG